MISAVFEPKRRFRLIEFSYWNYVPNQAQNISIFLNTLEETCIFNIVSSCGRRPVGLVQHTVEIPGDLLNTGTYYITLMIVKNSTSKLYTHDKTVTFEVTEGEREGHWYGNIPGMIRPKLKWTTTSRKSSDFLPAGELKT
jgi:lipopolysaccharide transport system ATP-binding protein